PSPGEVLDIVREWPSAWAKARGLALLATSVADGERTRVLDEALANARAIEVQSEGYWEEGLFIGGPSDGLFERDGALVSLLPLVDGDTSRQARKEAVAAAQAALAAALESVKHGTWSYMGAWFGAAPVLLAGQLPHAEAQKLVEHALDAARGVRR